MLPRLEYYPGIVLNYLQISVRNILTRESCKPKKLILKCIL